MTQQNDAIPADNAFDIELKTLIETNFFTLAYEIEEHIRHGWRIHQEHYPVHMFTHYEVTLYKNLSTINRVRDSIDSVLEARGEANKEARKENVTKMHEARKQKSQERKANSSAKTMMESVLKVKEEVNE